MDPGLHACDADGCMNQIEPEYDEDDGYWTNPPDGWLAVYVLKHDTERIEFEFCSEEHLAQRMQQPLPHGVVRSEPPSSRRDSILLGAALLAALGIFVLGVVSALGLLLDLLT